MLLWPCISIDWKVKQNIVHVLFSVPSMLDLFFCLCFKSVCVCACALARCICGEWQGQKKMERRLKDLALKKCRWLRLNHSHPTNQIMSKSRDTDCHSTIFRLYFPFLVNISSFFFFFFNYLFFVMFIMYTVVMIITRQPD